MKTCVGAKKGFTLAELLIVVAIIGVLVAVAMPVFNGQLERSRQATDMANMRAAESAAVAEYLTTGESGLYYFDIDAGTVSRTARPARGYGKSSADASTFWPGGNAFGVPNQDGEPRYVAVEIDENGGVSFMWGGYGLQYSKVVAQFADRSAELTAETAETRLYADRDAMRAVAASFLGMTKDEIIEATGLNPDYQGRLTNDEGVMIFDYEVASGGTGVLHFKGDSSVLAGLGFDASGVGEKASNSWSDSKTRPMFSDYMNEGREVQIKIGKVTYDADGKANSISVWTHVVKGDNSAAPEELSGIVVTK